MANSRDPHAAEKAEGYFNEMKKLYDAGNRNCKPNRVSFTAAINAWSRSKDPNASNKARGILDEMKLLEASGDTDCSPDVITYTSLLKVVAMSKSKDKAVEAWDIFSEMVKGGVQPNEFVYGTVLQACAYSDSYDLPVREVAFQIALRTIQRAHEETKDSIKAFSFFFQAAAGLGHDEEVKTIYRWCCDSGFQDNEWTRSVMREAFSTMVEEGHIIDASEDIETRLTRLKSVIHACVTSRDDPDAASKAEAAYDGIKALNFNLDTTAFTSLITTLAYSRHPQAAIKAEEYLNEMKALFEAGDANCKPDRITYNAVINAWSRSKDPYALNKARVIIDEMKLLFASGDTDCSPDSITFTSLLLGVAKSKSHEKAVEAWDILSEMDERGIQPDDKVFGTVLSACAFSDRFGQQARERAFNIAVQTIQRAYAETKPSRETVNFFFKAIIELGHDDEAAKVYKQYCDSAFQDDEQIRHFISTKLCQGKAGNADEESMEKFLSLRSVIYECVKSRDPDAASKAEAAYDRIKLLGLHRDTTMFTSLITTLAYSRHPQAAIKAEGYFNEMKALFEAGDTNCKPNRMTYNAVINAWSRSEDPHALKKARGLLEEMDVLFSSGDTGCSPDVIRFNLLLQVVARSKSEEKAAEAWDILSEIDERGIQPDSRMFGAVLMACAYSNDFGRKTREHAFIIAFDTIQRAHAEGKVSREAFGYFFMAAAGLGHDDEVEKVYRLCCSAGFQDDKWMKRVLREEYSELISQSQVGSDGDDLIAVDISPERLIYECAKIRTPAAARKADMAYDQMRALDLHLNTSTFNSLLWSWSNSRDPQAAIKSEGYLNEMTKLFEAGDRDCRPDRITFRAVIKALLVSKDPFAPRKARGLLAEMKRLEACGYTDCSPDVIFYTQLLYILAKDGSRTKAEEAWQIFSEMDERGIQPDDRVFGTVLMACAFSDSCDLQARERAFSIALQTIQRAYAETRPSKETFLYFFKAAAGLLHEKEVAMVYKWCCDSGLQDDEQIRRLMRHAFSEMQLQGRPVNTDKESAATFFNLKSLIHDCMKSRHPDAAIKSVAAYDRIKTLGLNLDTTTYTSLITTMAYSRDLQGAVKAEGYLNEMKELFKAGDTNCKPNRMTYNAVINAWSRSIDRNASSKARGLIEEMKQLEASGDSDCSPDVFTYISLMKSWAKGDSKDKAIEAWDVLSEMDECGIRPVAKVFGTMLMSCAFSNLFDLQTREVAFHVAMQTIQRAHAESMLSKDAFAFFLAAAEGLDHDEEVATVLKWCCDSGFQDDERIRHAMRKAFPEMVNGDDYDNSLATFFSLRGVIHKCAKSRTPVAARKAEAAYDGIRALGLPLDSTSFSSLISMLSYSHDPQAVAIKAEGYLNEMKSSFEAGERRCKPDRIKFNVVINAWLKSKDRDAARRAKGLIREMKRLEARGYTDCSPDVITYTSLLHILAKGNYINKAVEAWDILSEMDDRGIQPNEQVFGTVLMACAYSNAFDVQTRERAFQIALLTIERGHGRTELSKEAFGFFFTAAEGLNHDEEVEKVYKLCCDAGFQDDERIRFFRNKVGCVADDS